MTIPIGQVSLSHTNAETRIHEMNINTVYMFENSMTETP